jgi:hypothetical protein
MDTAKGISFPHERRDMADYRGFGKRDRRSCR